MRFFIFKRAFHLSGVSLTIARIINFNSNGVFVGGAAVDSNLSNILLLPVFGCKYFLIYSISMSV